MTNPVNKLTEYLLSKLPKVSPAFIQLAKTPTIAIGAWLALALIPLLLGVSVTEDLKKLERRGPSQKKEVVANLVLMVLLGCMGAAVAEMEGESMAMAAFGGLVGALAGMAFKRNRLWVRFIRRGELPKLSQLF